MELLLVVAFGFLLMIGLMFAVSSEGSNPTRQQMRNRIAFNRWKRKWIKRLTPDEVIAPFIGGLLILFVVVLFTAKLHGVI